MIYGKHGNCDGSELTENVSPPAATAADGHPEPPRDATVGVRAGHTKQLYLHLSDFAGPAAVVFPLWHIRELHFSPAKLMCAQHFLHTRSPRRHCSHWTYIISSFVAHPTAPHHGRSLPVPNASGLTSSYIYICIKVHHFIYVYHIIILDSQPPPLRPLTVFYFSSRINFLRSGVRCYSRPPPAVSPEPLEGVSWARGIARVTYSSYEEIIIYTSPAMFLHYFWCWLEKKME